MKNIFSLRYCQITFTKYTIEEILFVLSSCTTMSFNEFYAASVFSSSNLCCFGKDITWPEKDTN